MNIALKNGFLVTPLNNSFKVEKKDIYIYDGKVSFDKKHDLKIDKEYNLNEAVIMPGLVNAHHHIYSTLSKGIPVKGPLKDFQGTLEKLWWKLDRVLQKEDVIASTVITLEESIKQGVSTIFDHHISVPFIKGSLEEMKRVFGKYCLNGVLAFEISDRNGKEIFNESLAENIDFYNKHLNSKYIKGTIGMHASFTISEDSMKTIKETIKDAPIHIHVAEAQSDVDKTLEMSGLRVIERLEKYDLLNKNSLIVHGNILNEKELQILSEKEIFVIHNPDSNMNNALKIKNISQTLSQNITLTVGTDGMTSNMLKSYKNAFILNRYLNQDPDTGWDEAMKVLLNAFKLKEAYGFDLGVREGEEADMIILDYIPATPFNDNTFLGHFLFGITEARVKHFFKREHILMEDYKLTKTAQNDFFNNTRKNSVKLFQRFENLN